jgi:hypothetical protein
MSNIVALPNVLVEDASEEADLGLTVLMSRERLAVK